MSKLPWVRRAVGADQPGPVDREAHRQPLDRDVVHDLVEGALQERRIDRRERLVALSRQPGGEGHPVLLGNADVEAAVRKPLGKQVEPGARWHRRRDGDNAVVVLGLANQAVGEHARIAGRVRLRLRLGARDDVELADAVVLVGRLLGRIVALAFLRDGVHQHRAGLLVVAEVLQHRQQMVQIVTVDRADVIQAQFLEQRAAGDHAAGIFLGPPGGLLEALGETVGDVTRHLAQRAVRLRRQQLRQIGAHRADGRRDRHVVVVQDDNQPGVHRARVVHGLVRHAGAHRAIADHGDDVVVVAGQIARHRHAKASRDRGRAVRGAERVVLALRPARKTAEPTALTQRASTRPPAGQDLVRIGLMADVPQDQIARRVEDMVQRHGKLDDAQARPQMSAGLRDGVDRLLPQLVGQLAQLALRQTAQISRQADLIQQRCIATRLGHGLPLRAARGYCLSHFGGDLISSFNYKTRNPSQRVCAFIEHIKTGDGRGNQFAGT